MEFNASLIRFTRSGAYSNFGRRRQGFSWKTLPGLICFSKTGLWLARI